MKIKRSTRLSLKYATPQKQTTLRRILEEYGRTVNCFIDLFWSSCPENREILKPVYDGVESWLGATMRQTAAREAAGMVRSVKNKRNAADVKPKHTGTHMTLPDNIVNFQEPKTATEFDAWLRLRNIGNGIGLSLPVRLHRHYKSLAERGRRINYIVTADEVKVCFKIETGPKKKVETAIGVDSGIKALAGLSTGEQLGTDIETHINRIKRCKHGSKGQQRARRALRQRIDEVAKAVAKKADLVVVEKLKGITLNRKNGSKRRRRRREHRRSLGSWNIRYWLTRVQQRCEDNRVVFRSVPAFNTSIMCSACDHVERSNRNGSKFRCRKCGRTGNADINAARNILSRFLLGPYGAEFKLRVA